MRQLRRRFAAGAALAIALVLVASSPAAAAPPDNDDFDAAVLITAIPAAETADTTEATVADDDPTCVGLDTHTVWYDLLLAEETEVVFDTFGSDYDTTLSVFTGERGNLEFVDCNDDSGSLQSRVRFTAAAGVTYHLMVGSFFDSPGGHLELHGAVLPPPVTITVTLDPSGTVTSSGAAVIHGTLTCSRPVTLTVTGTLREQNGKRVTVGSYRTSVDCTGSTSWQATVLGETGIYKRGTATGVAVAEFIDQVRQEVSRARASGQVSLR
jgi:hypothetical protein